TSAPARGFTGRYRVGPEDAPIRIVMFTDHQCPDCKTIEGQVSELIRTRADVSVSIRYFPFNSDCNRHAPNNTRHPNACWAARAAEAAGMLWGAEGFWKMHSWLFAHDGRFETEAELLAGIRSLGYDPANFVATMTGPETLARVQADCEEAIDLGLFFTPMIFINGVEFRGWNVPNALARTVAEVAATNPPRRLPVHDVPARAREKFLADWRDWNGGQPITLPAEPHAWTLGPADARVRIVLWGDYQEPQTARHDQLIRRFMTGRNDVQYTYRHYPFNNECNRRVQSKRFPLACLAARAAEAAGQLGGNDGFWKMHAWLMDNQASVGAESLRAAAPQLGLDSAQLFGALTGAAGARHIYDDIEAGAQLPQLRHGAPPGVFGIPTVFVNGKYVPRLLLQGEPVLEEILMVAAAE
ncbi:MAG: thioredoxin domain-containing protein, partial [Planctomycetota bacterium]